MRHEIVISRTAVYGIVEGLTVDASQKTDVPFDTIWASGSDSAKLDIWWRAGINDLEQNLRQHLQMSSVTFDLMASGHDYLLSLDMHPRWNTRLSGLLANRVQEYMIYSVMGGWISDMNISGLPDYQTMSADAITGITDIILSKRLDYTEGDRHDSGDHKKDASEGDNNTYGDRHDSGDHKKDASEGDNNTYGDRHDSGDHQKPPRRVHRVKWF